MSPSDCGISCCPFQFVSACVFVLFSAHFKKPSINFLQGLYQKAEVLYSQGEFELALMFYHRGHKLRPELQEFTRGINKAQEAIGNSVGSKIFRMGSLKTNNYLQCESIGMKGAVNDLIWAVHCTRSICCFT